MEKNFGQIRKSLDIHRKATEEKSKGTDHYRVDRSSAEGYFDLHPKWREKIRELFNEIHSLGEEVVYVDICGRASGERMGADQSYTFSLKTPEIKKAFSGEGDHFIDGDIFNSNDFSKFIKTLEEDGVNPALVTFEPIVGLQAYTPMFVKLEGSPSYEEVTYGQLGKRLVDMIEILRPGGYIYLNKPFQFDGSTRDWSQGKSVEEYGLSLDIKKLVKKMGCKVEISGALGGPYFLIQKPLVPKKKK